MKTLQGTITSLKNQQTAVVTVSRRLLHPLYKKYVKRTKKYACHYEGMELTLGQEVTIVGCRPISKTKHFRVLEVVKAAKLSAKPAAKTTKTAKTAKPAAKAKKAEPKKTKTEKK